MAKIHLEIVSCNQCPKKDERNPWSSDGWDRMIDWHCTEADRKIAWSVEWHDRVPIPDWCPLLCKAETKTEETPMAKKLASAGTTTRIEFKSKTYPKIDFVSDTYPKVDLTSVAEDFGAEPVGKRSVDPLDIEGRGPTLQEVRWPVISRPELPKSGLIHTMARFMEELDGKTNGTVLARVQPVPSEEGDERCYDVKLLLADHPSTQSLLFTVTESPNGLAIGGWREDDLEVDGQDALIDFLREVAMSSTVRTRVQNLMLAADDMVLNVRQAPKQKRTRKTKDEKPKRTRKTKDGKPNDSK